MPSTEPAARPEGIPKQGTIVGGKYRIGELIGVGGMGAIVSAHHLEIGAEVAIKILLPELARQAEWAARLMREARAVASIRSERVARVHDVGRLDDGTPYIVMERLEGKSLDHLLRDGGPMPVEEAVDTLLQVCEALSEAHPLGIVHRDLKPSNLFVTARPDGSRLIKVLDFGISKALLKDDLSSNISSLTRTQSVLGSPQYMSPEQIRSSKSVDARTDIWALGVILHKLVTGRLPFEAETAAAYLATVAADPPTPLSLHRTEVPARLEKVVLRCLEKDIRRRYQNVARLARALSPFAGEEGAACAERTMRRFEEDPSEPDPESISSPDAGRDSASSAAVAPVLPQTSSRRTRWWAGAGLLLGFAALALLIRNQRARPEPSHDAPPSALAVAASSAPAIASSPPPARADSSSAVPPVAAPDVPPSKPARVPRTAASPVRRPAASEAQPPAAPESSAPPQSAAPQPSSTAKLPSVTSAPPKLKGPMEAEL